MGKELDFREREVLRIVVDKFTTTGEGANSFYVAEKLPFDLSPSTVRNIMASLQAKGFLRSEGRRGKFPTDKALKEYVTRLLKIKPWRGKTIQPHIEPSGDIEELLKEAAKNLSLFSGSLSLLVSPSIFHIPFSHIKFIRAGEKNFLVLLTTPSGLLLTQAFRANRDYSQKELDRASEILNRDYKGRTLQDVAQNIKLRMGRQINTLKEVLENLTVLLRKIDMVVEGEALLLEKLEGSLEKVREILKIFEEKKKLLEFLQNLDLGEDIKVLWGENLPFPHGEGYVFLLYPYSPKGVAAIFGPKHLKYNQALAALDVTGEFLKKFFLPEVPDER